MSRYEMNSGRVERAESAQLKPELSQLKTHYSVPAPVALENQRYSADNRLPNVVIHANIDADRLDSRSSITELINGRGSESTRVREKDIAPKKDGSPPMVKVELQDLNGQSKTKPDFIIHKNGQIEVLSDPEKTGTKSVTVQVERSENQLEPNTLQQRSVDKLVIYLNDRVHANYPGLDKRGLVIEDNQGLVSETTRKSISKSNDDTKFSAETQSAINSAQRFSGGHGVISHEGLEQYVPDRGVPRQLDESEVTAAMKDAVSAMFGPDKADPYETVRKRGESDYAIGRYGLSAKLIANWLEKELGNPPDPNKIDELVKAGKLSKEFAEQLRKGDFAQNFARFIEQLKSGDHAPSREQLKMFLPKELQEEIATNVISTLSKQLDGDAGKVSLAMQLGHVPEGAELNDANNKTYMEAAQRYYGLATAKQLTQPGEKIEWNGGSPSGNLIAQTAKQTAESMGTVGYCARGVETALSKLGINFSGNACDTVGFFENDKRFRQVDMSNIKPGDIVVRGASAGHPYGHIFVYLGNGMEASDHVQQLTDGSVYGQSKAFRMTA